MQEVPAAAVVVGDGVLVVFGMRPNLSRPRPLKARVEFASKPGSSMPVAAGLSVRIQVPG